jgi:TfoX/Sxy family transcriptional regulator of competence genes
MVYDEEVAQRFRDALTEMNDVTEKRMIGGLCFLLNGNMIGAADRTKDGMKRLMFRVGKDNDAAAAALTGAQPMVQGGRRMTGFFFVDQNDCDDDTFSAWLTLALGFVSELPPK